MSDPSPHQRKVGAPKPKKASAWFDYVLVLLVFGDAVALIWFLAFIAPGAKESFEQWETILGIFGIGMELWIVPQLLKGVFKSGGLEKVFALLRRPENRFQVIVTTALVVFIVPRLYRFSFEPVDSFSGEPVDHAQVYSIGTQQISVDQNELFRSGHYTFVLKKPPDFDDSHALEATLTPMDLFRRKRVTAELEPKQIQVALPRGAQVFVLSRTGWQELVGFNPIARAGCRQFRLVFSDGTTNEGFVYLSGSRHREVVARQALKRSKAECYP